MYTDTTPNTQMVRITTHLLEQYLTNPPYVTLDVLTFFQRMRDFDLERRQRHRGRKVGRYAPIH